VHWKRSTKHLKGSITASNVGWTKWRPSDPTSPHWYGASHLERLMAAYIAYEQERDCRPARQLRVAVSGKDRLSGNGSSSVLESEHRWVPVASGIIRRHWSRPFDSREYTCAALQRILVWGIALRS
jgi:hypothetical protein